MVGETVGAVAKAQIHVGLTFRASRPANGVAAASASPPATFAARANSAPCRVGSPVMPVATAARIRPALGSTTARACARPYCIAYQPARYAPTRARPRPVADRRGTPAAVAIALVSASVVAGSRRRAPSTSRRDSAVTVYVWAATVAAAGSALIIRPPLAPSRTSSPRHPAMTAGPAGDDLATTSYAQTAPASGTATESARAPPAKPATPSAAAVSPVASPNATVGDTRPDGIGRAGRSTASTSRSAQTFAAMPAQYMQIDAVANAGVRALRTPAAAAPAKTSPGTDRAAGARTNSAMSRTRGLVMAGRRCHAPM